MPKPRRNRLSREDIEYLLSLGLKRCFKCEKTKPLAEFFKNRARPDGHSSDCRECSKDASKKWAQVNVEHVRERDRVHYADNRERSSARINQWRLDNPERASAIAKRYRVRNPLAERLRKGRYRVDIQGNTFADIAPEDLKSYWEANGIAADRCYYSGELLGGNWHLDHKTPVSRGGTHTVDNLVPCSADVNQLKHNRTAEEFIEIMREVAA